MLCTVVRVFYRSVCCNLSQEAYGVAISVTLILNHAELDGVREDFG